MNDIKLRLEMQLSAGDLVGTREAIFEALQSAAVQILALSPNTGLIDVPRGKMAYIFEASAKAKAEAEEPDDGA